MLEYLRNASEKLVAKILIGLLAFSFVGWGVAEWVFSTAAKEKALVQVGNTTITSQGFNEERTSVLSKQSREQQKQIYTDVNAQNQFNNRTLSNLINKILMEKRANDLKFVITDAQIAHEIRMLPDFQEAGVFSTMLMDRYLSNTGMTENALVELIKKDVLNTMVMGAVSMPMDVPKFVLDANYKAKYMEREIEYNTVKFSDFKISESPNEEQLKTFYAQNPKKVSESRDLSYVFVSAKMSMPDTYEMGLKAAQDLEDDIIAGDSLKEAAAKNKAKFVSIKNITRQTLYTDSMITDLIASRVFSMEEGMESELIEIKEGFLILNIDKITDEHTADFASVKSELIADWKKSEQKKKAYIQANELLVNLNKSNEWDKKTKATVSRAKGASVDLLSAAFSSELGTNTLVPGNNTYHVLRVVKEITPIINTVNMTSVRFEAQKIAKNALFDDYLTFLMREYPIKINKKAFEKNFQSK